MLKLGFCSVNELDKILIVYILLFLFIGMCFLKVVEYLYYFVVGLLYYLGLKLGIFFLVKVLGFRILDR